MTADPSTSVGVLGLELARSETVPSTSRHSTPMIVLGVVFLFAGMTFALVRRRPRRPVP
jgi:hypothetical protein